MAVSQPKPKSTAKPKPKPAAKPKPKSKSSSPKKKVTGGNILKRFSLSKNTRLREQLIRELAASELQRRNQLNRNYRFGPTLERTTASEIRKHQEYDTKSNKFLITELIKINPADKEYVTYKYRDLYDM